MTKSRIAWFSIHPNHYNSFLFKTLEDSLSLELELFFCNPVLSKYPWQKEEPRRATDYYFSKVLGIDWRVLWRFLYVKKGTFRAVVVAGWAEPTLILLLTIFRFLGREYIVLTDRPNEKRAANLKQWLRSRWLKWILSGCRAILLAGEDGRRILTSWGARTESILTFPYTTDLGLFSPGNGFPASLSNPLRILASGRLDISIKGYDIALRGLAMLKEQRPDIQFRYTIAGTGPDEAIVRTLIGENGLTEEVELAGWLEIDRLPEFYRSADILLHTAIDDPFCNAVLEAMACGLIVIGSDSTGAVMDRIQNRHNGMVIRTGIAPDAAAAIAYVADCSPSDVQSLKRNSLGTARQWSVDRNVSIIRELIGAT